ncbi:MAG: DsbE family thiol:disulfide interchange protein [Hyphomicrobiaceae bacterium]|nr:DsbE family thiol:disulfide interchange protein [Hyphomicrobiaceae bacterium]
MSEPADTRPQRSLIAFLPLIAFLLIGGVFLFALSSGRDPQALPSTLIGQPAPHTALPALEGLGGPAGPVPGFDTADFAGRVTILNVWASWCGPCRQEHPLLMRLAERGDITLTGVNYKDDPENARRFLGALGNPYDEIGTDREGRAVIDWGVYGVPETFIIDAAGIVRHKHIGPLTEEALRETFLPALEAALAGPAS